MRIGPRDHHLARLDGLAQGFEDVACEFGQLVEEQHPPVVRETHLARLGIPPAADDRCH